MAKITKLGEWVDSPWPTPDWRIRDCVLVDDRETDTQLTVQHAINVDEFRRTNMGRGAYFTINLDTGMGSDHEETIGIPINKADRDRIVAVLQGVRFPDEV